MKIIVWTKPSCVQCTAVKKLLTQEGAPFEEKDLTLPEHELQLKAFKENGMLSAPITEYKGTLVPGFNRDSIKMLVLMMEADLASKVEDLS